MIKYEKKPGIYIFTNLVNGKVYVGETMNMRRRMREHYKYAIQIIDKAINKYGLDNFDIQVTYYPYADKKFLVNLEHLLIKAKDSLVINGKGYNVCPLGTDCTGLKASDKTRKLMSEAKKGKPLSTEHREALSKSAKGNTNGQGNKGRTYTALTLKRMSDSKMGCGHTLESRAKLSAAAKGKPKSPETIENMRIAQVNRRLKASNAPLGSLLRI